MNDTSQLNRPAAFSMSYDMLFDDAENARDGVELIAKTEDAAFYYINDENSRFDKKFVKASGTRQEPDFVTFEFSATYPNRRFEDDIPASRLESDELSADLYDAIRDEVEEQTMDQERIDYIIGDDVLPYRATEHLFTKEQRGLAYYDRNPDGNQLDMREEARAFDGLKTFEEKCADEQLDTEGQVVFEDDIPEAEINQPALRAGRVLTGPQVDEQVGGQWDR